MNIFYQWIQVAVHRSWSHRRIFPRDTGPCWSEIESYGSPAVVVVWVMWSGHVTGSHDIPGILATVCSWIYLQWGWSSWRRLPCECRSLCLWRPLLSNPCSPWNSTWKSVVQRYQLNTKFQSLNYTNICERIWEKGPLRAFSKKFFWSRITSELWQLWASDLEQIFSSIINEDLL